MQLNLQYAGGLKPSSGNKRFYDNHGFITKCKDNQLRTFNFLKTTGLEPGACKVTNICISNTHISQV